MVKLDYTITDPQERKALVERILKENPINPKYLEILADYLLDPKKKDHTILTPNRMVTVQKHETSFEGLAGKLENGEDGIYNMITNDKNIILSPSVSITLQDIEEVPGLKELRQAISNIEAQASVAVGYKAYKLKRMLIELRQEQYILKGSYRRPIYFIKTSKANAANIDLSETITISPDLLDVKSSGLISLYDPVSVSKLLNSYSALKEATYSDFESDMRWLLLDLEAIIDSSLKIYEPLLFDIMVYKIDGKSNQEIQELILKDWGVKHSLEYISALWRNKIPKLIAQAAKEQYLTWYFTYIEKGTWKRCSKCGQVKLAHPWFFSKNSTSKSGYYSHCKICRNRTNEQKLVPRCIKEAYHGD